MESAAFDRTHEQELDADVAIVGYRPVGQALAALLCRAGHRVAVFERFKDIYVFGSASSPSELPELLGELRAQLQMTPTLAPSGALS
jgi:2-polyprenyl-6-methoxyphenol hydroxylase-like FAD-dependent oxidoreductase